jgi:hypothetical protein
MSRDDLPETLAVAATVIAALVCVASLCVLNLRVAQMNALGCARQSAGTDLAIADCYTVRGLPCPDDICPR